MVFTILYMKNLGNREIKLLVKGYTARKVAQLEFEYKQSVSNVCAFSYVIL